MDKKKSKFRVGYGKPPHETRFKPGQSGNPGGRPKRNAITLVEALARELNTSITVTEGGKPKKITKLVAMAKQLTIKAVNGDLKAMTLLMKVLELVGIDTTDNLFPMLAAMRAIDARHEIAHQDGTSKTANSCLNDKVKNDNEAKQ